MSVQVIEIGSQISIGLDVVGDGGTGISGLSPSVSLVRFSDRFFLDWNDNTFKSSGWTTKFLPLTEVENGHYAPATAQSLASPMSVHGAYQLQFKAIMPGGAQGDASDSIIVLPSITDTQTDVVLLRKALKNRLEEAAGNPGTLILYDDDGTTPLITWSLRDSTGGAVTETTGAPARRSAGS